MCCGTTLEHSGLVKFVELCAQTRVAIEMHLRISSAKYCALDRPAKQATEP